MQHWTPLSDCTGRRTRSYGCLFSVGGGQWWRQRRDSNAEAMAKVQGGIIERQALCRGPKIQGVAVAATLEAVEGVGVHIDAEATGRAAGRAVQWTSTALLAGVAGTRYEAQQCEHLGDGDGRQQGREVNGGTRRIGLLLRLLMLGLAHVFAAFAGLGQLA